MSEPKYPKGTFYVGREVYVMPQTYHRNSPAVGYMAKVEKVGRKYAQLEKQRRYSDGIQFDLLSGRSSGGQYICRVYLSEEAYLAEKLRDQKRSAVKEFFGYAYNSRAHSLTDNQIDDILHIIGIKVTLPESVAVCPPVPPTED